MCCLWLYHCNFAKMPEKVIAGNLFFPIKVKLQWVTDPAGPEHQAGDFRLQQKCFSKEFFLGLGERLEEVAAFFLIQVENVTLILSLLHFWIVLQLWGLCYALGYFVINMVSFYFVGSSWQRLKVLERVFNRSEEWGKEYPNSSE